MARLGTQAKPIEDPSQEHPEVLQAQRIYLIDSLEGNPGSFPFDEDCNETTPEGLRIQSAQISNAITALQNLMTVDQKIASMSDLSQRAPQDGSEIYSTWLQLLEAKRAAILSILEGDQ